MAVDEAGQHEPVAEVDHARADGTGLTAVEEGGDAPVLDHDARGAARRLAGFGEDASGLDDHDIGERRRGNGQREREREGERGGGWEGSGHGGLGRSW